MEMKNKGWRKTVRMGCTIAMCFLLITGCGDDNEEPLPGGGGSDTPAADFIPAKGHQYEYAVENDDGSGGVATRWISAEEDSAGIKVYNMRTDVSAYGYTIPLNDRIFSIHGKTYTEIKLPEVWYQMVTVLDAMPDVEVLNTVIAGYPAYLTMTNPISNTSKIEVTGPSSQEQRVSYTDHGKDGLMTQTLIHNPGTSTVETVQVPAGSFVCNRFNYTVTKQTTIKLGDQTDTMTASEQITMWVAHGIGMVKVESFSETAMLMPDVSGGVKLVKSNSSSTTTLRKIH